MGLGLKDSPPGFDPSQVANSYGTDDYAPFAEGESDDDGGFAETEQL
jgi:DNA-directed RNA polymerase subunit alpha